MREKPWNPNQRAVSQLGLAPNDVEVLKEAYERSNKRTAALIKPLCAKEFTKEVADKLGPTSCLDALVNGVRTSGPDAAKQVISNVAEANGGIRPEPKAEGLEQVLVALSKEGKAFEKDLADHLGPEEAKRIAGAPELCADHRFFRADDR
jgi:hypothetical protein